MINWNMVCSIVVGIALYNLINSISKLIYEILKRR